MLMALMVVACGDFGGLTLLTIVLMLQSRSSERYAAALLIFGAAR